MATWPLIFPQNNLIQCWSRSQISKSEPSLYVTRPVTELEQVIIHIPALNWSPALAESKGDCRVHLFILMEEYCRELWKHCRILSRAGGPVPL